MSGFYWSGWQDYLSRSLGIGEPEIGSLLNKSLKPSVSSFFYFPYLQKIAFDVGKQKSQT